MVNTNNSKWLKFEWNEIYIYSPSIDYWIGEDIKTARNRQIDQTEKERGEKERERRERKKSKKWKLRENQ